MDSLGKEEDERVRGEGVGSERNTAIFLIFITEAKLAQKESGGLRKIDQHMYSSGG